MALITARRLEKSFVVGTFVCMCVILLHVGRERTIETSKPVAIIVVDGKHNPSASFGSVTTIQGDTAKIKH